MTPVEVEALSVPTPEPMLQVTPALEESFATEAVKFFVPPPLSDKLAGLTLTLMGVGVGGGVEALPPPLHPGRRVKVDNPANRKGKKLDFFVECLVSIERGGGGKVKLTLLPMIEEINAIVEAILAMEIVVLP